MGYGGGFIFKPINDSDVSGDKTLCWVTLDRTSGAITSTSAPLVSIETVVGETFSLIPDPVKPYFKFEDGGGDCLYGRLVNYPTAKADDIFKTEKIVKVRTVDGGVIDTLLALTKPAYQGPVQTIGAGDLGMFLADMLRKAANGEPDSDGTSSGPKKPSQQGPHKPDTAPKQ